jgi:hypothetical protein
LQYNILKKEVMMLMSSRSKISNHKLLRLIFLSIAFLIILFTFTSLGYAQVSGLNEKLQNYCISCGLPADQCTCGYPDQGQINKVNPAPEGGHSYWEHNRVVDPEPYQKIINEGFKITDICSWCGLPEDQCTCGDEVYYCEYCGLPEDQCTCGDEVYYCEYCGLPEDQCTCGVVEGYCEDCGLPLDQCTCIGMPPDLPPYGLADDIPVGALPIATGLAALITLLSTLSITSAGGTTPVEAFGELKALFGFNRIEAQAPPQTPPAEGRDPQEILRNPRFHDQVTDVDGKKWVYYRRPGDQAGAGWTSLEEYNQTLTQEKQGHTYSDRWGWSSEKDKQTYEANLEKQRAADHLEREARRKEEARLKEETQAQRKALEAKKEKLQAEAYRERYEAALKKRDQGMAEAEEWNRQVRILDLATKTVEFVKSAADKSIDVLADVTGPKGKTIKKIYRAASTMAGGVGEGMATGNWTDSLTDATGNVVGDLLEDSIGNKRYQSAYKVVREGAANAWQEGRKAYREGGDVKGAAALAFLEGAADKASSGFKETLGSATKSAYEVGEKGIKAGYNTFKEGGTISDTLIGASRGALEGTVDASIDLLAKDLLDTVIPEQGAISPELMADHQRKLFLAERPDLANQVADDWIPEYAYDKFRKEITGKLTKLAQDYIKGDTFSIN